MAMRRPRADAGGADLPLNLVEDPVLHAYPVLSSYLADTSWEDGSVRETATLLLFAEGPVLKAVLNDRALERSAWVSGRALPDLLDALETQLAADCADWRRRRTEVPGRRPPKRP